MTDYYKKAKLRDTDEERKDPIEARWLGRDPASDS
jgi:hypothetical protein